MLVEGYKGRSESQGTVKKGRTKLYVVQGSVQHDACRLDFTSSFPCEVLQDGD